MSNFNDRFNYQPIPGPSNADSILGLASNGVVCRTSVNTYLTRTITGTANQITVTNGDGVSGVPTLTLPSVLTLPGTINKLTLTAPSSGATLTIANGKTLTQNKSMTLTAADDTGIYTFPTGTNNIAPIFPTAVVYKSSGQTNITGDGTLATILCDTMVIDTASEYDSSTGIFTPSMAGLYLFTGTVGINGAFQVDNTILNVRLTSTGNPSVIYWLYDNPLAIPATQIAYYVSGSSLLYLISGQTVKLQIAVSGHATKTISTDANTWFSVGRIK